jgi:hypothetical protein
VRDFSTRPQRSGPAALEVAAVALAGLALLWASYAAFASRRDARERRASVEEARRDLESTRTRLSALESRAGDVALARQTLLTLDAPPPRVLASLGELMPDDVRLEGISLRYGERLELEMRVIARSSTAYDVFLERLQSSPSFESVFPGEENRDGEVRAAVRAGYRGGVS